MKFSKLCCLLIPLLLLLIGCSGSGETEPALISADNVSGDLVYSIYAGNTVTITGYRGSDRVLVLPDRIDTRPVTAIGDYAFADQSGIVYLTLGKYVRSIGDYAFSGCELLCELELGGKVQRVGEYAFSDCIGMTRLTVGNGVKELGIGAFSDCVSLCEAEIGDGITTLPSGIFVGCDSLVTVRMGKNITTIEEEAFYQCGLLRNVIFGKSVKKIAARAFAYCDGLEQITLEGKIAEVSNEAFFCCTQLKSLTLGKALRTIEDGAFYGCSSLREVKGGEKLQQVGYSVWEGAPWLTDQEEPFLMIGDGILLRYNGEGGEVRIPAGVKIIADAFSGCTNLTSVIIPDSVTDIGTYAFYSCGSLTSVTRGKRTRYSHPAPSVGCPEEHRTECLQILPCPVGCQLSRIGEKILRHRD